MDFSLESLLGNRDIALSNAILEPLQFSDFGNQSILIQRDDLIHPIVSGNKWRKLEGWIRYAKENNIHTLVTFGGAYSNHLNALACASAQFGFKSTAFIRGEEVSNQMIALNKLWGMDLIFTDRTSYKNKQTLFEKHFNHSTSYFIDEGGAGIFGAKGCEEIVYELTLSYDKIFCPVGTATTLQGIAQAIKNKNLKTIAEGICVLKGATNIDKTLIESKLTEHYKIHHQFHEGGYAKSNETLFDFIKMFASHTGILLDQVYTAKMMKAVFTLAEQNYFEPNSKIICVHTGGLMGLMGVL